MIDFEQILINRLIIHKVLAKTRGQDHSTVEPSTEITIVDHASLTLIRDRLNRAAGKESKAFNLSIENKGQGSFYEYMFDLVDQDDDDFIENTTTVAEMLAECQTRIQIPSSYLMIMDCIDNETKRAVVIAIKAEPHKALKLSFGKEGAAQIDILDEVFLSPSQKLFKIGCIYQEKDDDNGNREFGCFLYDDQFRPDSHPAEYFYSDFLGFSVDDNAKIQSQRFFDKTNLFIHENVDDTVTKSNLLSALKNVFTADRQPIIHPTGFAEQFIPKEEGLRDMYLYEVCDQFPLSVVKDDALLKSRLTKRKMSFPSKILLSGPEDDFDDQVNVINNEEQMKNLDTEDQGYTILVIKGRPYSTDD